MLKLSMWSDRGRRDDVIVYPAANKWRRIGTGLVLMAVTAMCVGTVYSELGGGAAETDAADIPIPLLGGSPDHASRLHARQLAPTTTGFAPISVADHIAVPDRFVVAQAEPVDTVASAGTEPTTATNLIAPASSPVADARTAATDSGPAPVDRRAATSQTANKKPARSTTVVQFYQLSDGRQITVRRPAAADTNSAGTPFEPWDRSIATARPEQRHIRLARPVPFDPPF